MEKEKIKLIVRELIDSDSAVRTDDGDLIYKNIVELFNNKNIVELDFSEINLMTTAFLNAAIGQLYSSYSGEELNQTLSLVNVADDDRILFKKVIDRAKQYFANKKNFEDSANSAIYGS
jgi:hypothetical protein